VGNFVLSAARPRRLRSFPNSLSEFSVPLLPECQSRYKGILEAPRPGEDLTDCIDRLAAENQFVFIDFQGSANQDMIAAMSRATLVLVPMQAKSEDATVSKKAIVQLRSQEKVLQRHIPYAVLFTRTNALIATKEQASICDGIKSANIPCFNTALNERVAFSSMLARKLALDELDKNETNGLPKAQENAMLLVTELLDRIRSEKGK